MLRTGIETIICLSPNFLYVYVYVCFGVLHASDTECSKIAAPACSYVIGHQPSLDSD